MALATAILLAVSLGGPWASSIGGPVRRAASVMAAAISGHRTAAQDSRAGLPVSSIARTASRSAQSVIASAPSPVVHAPTRLGVVAPAIGALFDGNGAHFCTASVVTGGHGDLLITAAHCVYGPGGSRPGMVFVPGYHDGVRPYGSWPISSVTVDPRWIASQDPDADFAFLTVAPVGGRKIANVVGAYPLARAPDPGSTIELFGYPAGLDEPLACAAPAGTESPSQVEIYCPDYTSGTSGGPWLADYDPRSGTGEVVGVIGGYEQGGDTPDISYSSCFDASVRALYDQLR